MPGHELRHRQLLLAVGLLLEHVVHLRRRRGRRGAENSLQHPLAPMYGAGPRWLRCADQHLAHRQDAAAPLVGILDAIPGGLVPAGLLAREVLDAVMLGQRITEKAPVGIDEFENAAILHHDRVGEHQQLLRHLIAQVVLKVRGILVGVWLGAVESIELQPLHQEAEQQPVARAPVPDHAANLGVEHLLVAQLPLVGKLNECLVWKAAPEEVRQPSREFVVAEQLNVVRRSASRFTTRSVVPQYQKVRRHQNRLERQPKRRFEILLLRLSLIEEFGIFFRLVRRYRSMKRTAREVSQEFRDELPLRLILRCWPLLQLQQAGIKRPLVGAGSARVHRDHLIEKDLGRAEVLLDKEGRDRQTLSQRVEAAVARILRQETRDEMRRMLRRGKHAIQADAAILERLKRSLPHRRLAPRHEEIANRVNVFASIQSPRTQRSWVRLAVQRLMGKDAFNPGHHSLALTGRRLRLTQRRHLPAAQPFPDFLPGVRLLDSLARSQVDPSLGLGRSVTRKAILGLQRTDHTLVFGCQHSFIFFLRRQPSCAGKNCCEDAH